MSKIYQTALPLQQQKQEDTTTCVYPSKQKRPLGVVGRLLTEIKWSDNFKGDIGEYYAIFRLMLKGIRVYSNVGCDGKTDLVIQHDSNYYPLDVKIAQWHKSGSSGNYSWEGVNARLVEAPVIPLIVVPATGECASGWYCKWRKRKNGEVVAPLGLEGLWD